MEYGHSVYPGRRVDDQGDRRKEAEKARRSGGKVSLPTSGGLSMLKKSDRLQTYAALVTSKANSNVAAIT